MYNGIVTVYKEAGFTSFDVVAKMRGIVKQRKIGHTGTLDPEAVGVLPVCLGSATKLCEMLTDHDKEYRAVMQLGITTDTQDLTGTVLNQKAVTVSAEAVQEAARSFIGGYDQIPPMYSALKVNGKRLYELAREGKVVERKPRRIEITEIEIQTMEDSLVTMRVVCGKGTYIRTLIHDIGEKLGCGAAMQSLERTRVGQFTAEQAYTLGQLETLQKQNRLQEVILPLEQVFEKLPICRLKSEFNRLLQNGNPLREEMFCQPVNLSQKRFRIHDGEDRFLGVYFLKENGIFYPEKMFLENL